MASCSRSRGTRTWLLARRFFVFLFVAWRFQQLAAQPQAPRKLMRLEDASGHSFSEERVGTLFADEVCYEPARRCAHSFNYRGMRIMGCTSLDHTSHWCSLDEDYERHKRSATCKRKPCNKCYLRDIRCLAVFAHEGTTVEGCVPDGQTSVLFCKDAFGAKLECVPCAVEAVGADRKCYQVAHRCEPDFTYDGRLYRGCTKTGRSKPWCSNVRTPTLAEIEDTMGRSWSECDEVPCDECYLRKRECKPVFEYNGQVFVGCTNVTGSWWCSKEERHLEGQNDKVRCAKCETQHYLAMPTCWKLHPECMGSFNYLGKRYIGCTKVGSGRQWCSMDWDYDDVNMRFRYCLETECTVGKELVDGAHMDPSQCHEPAFDCAPEFNYRGVHVVGCTTLGKYQHWCSRDVEYKGRWNYCKPKSCKTCWVRSPGCVDEFTYAGVTYAGCTAVDHDTPWCSRAATFLGAKASLNMSTNFMSCTNCADAESAAAGDWGQKLCHFPTKACVKSFAFNGRRYEGCIRTEENSHWCSLKPDPVKWGVDFALCESRVCPQCWKPNAACQASFLYQDKLHEGCVTENEPFPWCATSRRYVTGSGQWRFCAKCDAEEADFLELDDVGHDALPEDALANVTSQSRAHNATDESETSSSMCYKPAEGCVLAFTFDGDDIKGCTKKMADRYWCSNLQRLPINSGEYQYCEQRPCDDCWVRHPSCKPSFTVGGKKVHGCARTSDQRWCSTDLVFQGVVGTARRCYMCDKIPRSTRCWMPAKSCVQPFLYDGKMMPGCVEDIYTGQAWCSKVRHFDSIVSGTHGKDWCAAVPCDTVCWLPLKGCATSFMHRGKMVRGCVAEETDRAWCSSEASVVSPNAGKHFCKAVPCTSICYKVDDTCEQFFTYKGRRYSSCIPGKDGHWCSQTPEFVDGADDWRYCTPVDCSEVCYIPAKTCVQPFEHEGQRISGCVRGSLAQDQPWCSQSVQASTSSRDLCVQVDCREVCWKRHPDCVAQFRYKQQRWTGCMQDERILGESKPWCSRTVQYHDGDAGWEPCSMIPCSEADCDTPACEGFMLLKAFDGRCVAPQGRRGGTPSWSLALGDDCRFPDPDGMEIKEVRAREGYVMLRHISGKCLHPETNAFKDNDRLIVHAECDGSTSQLFRKIKQGDNFVLQHYSDRCVDITNDTTDEGKHEDTLVLTVNCPTVALLPPPLLDGAPVEPASFTFGERLFALRFYPRPCVWEEWTDWQRCSVPCGNGVELRHRGIAQHQERYGKLCLGKKAESRPCGKVCPVHCVVGEWGLWGPCTKPCGEGIRKRVKNVLVYAKHGGSCDVPEEVAPCMTHACPQACKWGEWSDWTKCSATCGGGNKVKNRPIFQHAAHGGAPCLEQPRVLKRCGMESCPQHCALGEWLEWETCTLTCDGGTKKRFRSQVTAPRFGGKSCGVVSSQTKACNTVPCPKDCVFLPWSAWGACSSTCGGGERMRRRLTLPAIWGGKACEGPLTHDTACNSHGCPVKCIWGVWSEWTDCTVTCGIGFRQRQRKHSKAAEAGGQPCIGPAFEKPKCNEQYCPFDCKWGAWSSWGSCPITCGGGNVVRHRNVLEPAHYGGRACGGPGKTGKTCNDQPCPIDCAWFPWSHWTPCTRTCGAGRTTRTRLKAHYEQYGGLSCVGSSQEINFCKSQQCPIDCIWNEWATWTDCSETCSETRDGNSTLGWKSRARSVRRTAQAGGNECYGTAFEKFACNVHSCPVDCLWREWGQWTSCPISCGGSTSTRSRDRWFVAQHGGTPCKGMELEKRVCNAESCPVDCSWSIWEPWSLCSTTCAGGVERRQRAELTISSFGGKQCEGRRFEKRACAQIHCPVDCAWEAWSPWNVCSRSCGGGRRDRFRVTKTPAEFGGLQCSGEAKIFEWCSTSACPKLNESTLRRKSGTLGDRDVMLKAGSTAGKPENTTGKVEIVSGEPDTVTVEEEEAEGYDYEEEELGLGGSVILLLAFVCLVSVCLAAFLQFMGKRKPEQPREAAEEEKEVEEEKKASPSGGEAEGAGGNEAVARY